MKDSNKPEETFVEMVSKALIIIACFSVGIPIGSNLLKRETQAPFNLKAAKISSKLLMTAKIVF